MSRVLSSSVVIKETKLSCEESVEAKQVHTNDMEEKSKTDSRIHFAKSGDADASDDHHEAMQLLARRTFCENGEAAAATKSEQQERPPQEAQSAIREDQAVRRSNSVSKMTQHFKALQEKMSGATGALEKSPQRAALQRSSHGVQRYRERKAQSGERFNTQPVTFEEVREAVLQNQRNAAAALGAGGDGAASSPSDELEPSKLSLAERVRLFEQPKASTDETAARSAAQERLSQRRRPSTRYKTQPITSEEVEVASRVSSLTADSQPQTSAEGKLIVS